MLFSVLSLSLEVAASPLGVMLDLTKKSSFAPGVVGPGNTLINDLKDTTTSTVNTFKNRYGEQQKSRIG